MITSLIFYGTHEVDTHTGSAYTNVCMRMKVSGVINLNSTFFENMRTAQYRVQCSTVQQMDSTAVLCVLS